MNKGRKKPLRLLSTIGFVVLSTFFGVGTAWILIGLWVIVVSKRDFPTAAAAGMPFLLVGGAVGFAVGLLIAICVSRSGSETEVRIETKYIGRRGRLKIYAGAPFAMSFGLISLLFSLLERSAVGSNAAPYVALVIFLAVLGLGLFLYDRIPSEYIIPVGVIGWLLIVGAAIFCGLQATAALGRTH